MTWRPPAEQKYIPVTVLIGPDWQNIKDARGTRRLDDPDDAVRLEEFLTGFQLGGQNRVAQLSK